MLRPAHASYAPWYVVDFDDQERGRLNLIGHLLKKLPKRDGQGKPVRLPTLRQKLHKERIPRGFLVRESY